MALLDLFNPLLDAIKKALGPFGKIFDILGKFWTNITTANERIGNLVSSIQSEIVAFKNFREDIAVRTKVISIPAAISKTQEFIAQLKAGWEAIVNLINDIKSQIGGGEPNPTEEAEQAIADIEKSGFGSLVKQFPKLFKGAEKVLGFITIVTSALDSILTAIDDLQQIVDTVTAIREEIETGSTVFLSQKNRRKRVRTIDGKSLNLRVGKLHQL